MGARAPFSEFLDEHRSAVLAFLRASVGADDAEDCFQETFLAALRGYERMNGANPRGWLLAIARRKAIDHHRSAAREPRPSDRLPDRAGPEPGGRRPELWAAVAKLPPRQREAVALRFAADLRYRDVAHAMGCSEEAARRSVHEGLRKLRRSLAERSHDES